MRTLDRYIAATFVKSLLLAVLSLGLFMVLQSLMVDLFNREFEARQTIIFHLLNLPNLMVQLAPPATLLAIVLTLSGLSRTQELVACYSIGVGLSRIVWLLLSIVFIEGCAVLILEDRILPALYKHRTNYFWHEMKKRPDFFLDIKQDKIWYRSRNLIYNLQRFDTRSNRILGMAVYTFDDNFHLTQVVDARTAEYTTQGWRLQDGIVTTFPEGSSFPKTTPFSHKELPIGETPQDFREIEKEVDGLRFKELARYIRRTRDAGADTKAYEVKFHSRMSLAFMPLVMAILGVPFSTRGRREGGAAKDFGFCLGLTFFYWLFYSVGLSLGKTGAVPAWFAAWAPSLIFLALAITLISRKKT